MTNHQNSRALLPNGLSDMLPPDAAFEAKAIARLMERCMYHGYERIKPPLVEFEESLFAGYTHELEKQTFRVMDPVSQRMMGVRADMTGQVARIAATRLQSVSRPLRLCYSGQVLRVKGNQLRPERQFAQAGIELIGAGNSLWADAEVILVMVQALQDLGLQDVSVDLTVPALIPALFSAADQKFLESDPLFSAIEQKDAGSIQAHGGAFSSVLMQLLACVGAATAGLEKMQAITLPLPAARERERLVSLITLIKEAKSDIMLTIDPLELRSWDFYCGVGFSLFSGCLGSEIGRGGRYTTENGEAAAGATLFMDTILPALPVEDPIKKVFVPYATAWTVREQLQQQGWITLVGLDPAADHKNEAKRLECHYIWGPNGVVPV